MRTWMKRIGIVTVAVVLLLAASVIAASAVNDSSATSQSATQTADMEVHFIDVGQGDATLIKCGGEAMLIDAGDDTKGTAIQNYLQKQGVKKLDYLVLTHPDSDHIGAAPVIITKFKIGKVFISNYEKDNSTYRKLMQALDEKRLSYATPKVGESYTLGSAKFTILAPNGEYQSPNNASIALLLENGDNRFLFSGDAEEEAEADILGNGISVLADVYQVGHHGSRTSSSKEFLEAIRPSWAIISCAEGNSYGHPHAKTLNELRSMGVKVFRTDEQGSIVAYCDGAEITWNCAPSETWKAGEPTGSSDGTASRPERQSGSAEDSESKSSILGTDKTNEGQKTEALTEPSDGGVEVHITKTGKKYHSAGCDSLSKSDIIVTLEQAKAKGLGPCSKCNPPQ